MIADSGALAEAMKAYYEDGEAPSTLKDFVADVREAGVALSIGNSIGGYAHDADTTDFKVCVDDEAGDYAIYDTATKQVDDTGDDGGCALADDGGAPALTAQP